MVTDGAVEDIEGLTPEEVADEIEELIASGFLEDVVTVDLGSGREEHVLELRYPFGHIP